MPSPTGRISVYDRDIDEEVDCTSSKLLQYEMMANSNDIQSIYTQNMIPEMRGLNKDRNLEMREGRLNSRQISKHEAINEVPSDEDDEEQEQILMEDNYLVVQKKPTEDLSPLRDSMRRSSMLKRGGRTPGRRSTIRKRDFDEVILDTKTESI